MRCFLTSLILLSTMIAHAADYPSIPIDKLLTKTQIDDLNVVGMTATQKETLRRAIIDSFLAGLEEGKKEGFKAASRANSIPNVIESQIDGDFEGWEGETIVKLTNGQIWQQNEYHYEYHYAFMPEVLIYRSGGGYKMKVAGTDQAIGVVRLK